MRCSRRGRRKTGAPSTTPPLVVPRRVVPSPAVDSGYAPMSIPARSGGSATPAPADARARASPPIRRAGRRGRSQPGDRCASRTRHPHPRATGPAPNVYAVGNSDGRHRGMCDRTNYRDRRFLEILLTPRTHLTSSVPEGKCCGPGGNRGRRPRPRVVPIGSLIESHAESASPCRRRAERRMAGPAGRGLGEPGTDHSGTRGGGRRDRVDADQRSWLHAVGLDNRGSFADFPPELVDRLLADVAGNWHRQGSAKT